MRHVKSISVAALMMALSGSAANATNFDLASSFSGTNGGTWSYGYIYGGTGTYFPNYTAASGSNPVEYWNDQSLPQTATYNTPSDAHNTSSSEANCACGTVVWLPGQATFHPGQNGEIAAYRFTAPTTGSYALDASFSGRDFVGPTDTQVSIEVGDELASPTFSGIVDGYAGDSSRASFGPSPTVNFSDTLSLEAGEYVYFEVAFDPAGSRSSGPFYYDTTGISATLASVPEPAVWAMLLLGFFGVGSMVRFANRKADQQLTA